MQFIVAASSAIWAGVCDVLSAVFPAHIVATLLHVEAELFLALGSFHDHVNGIGESHFPSLTSHCNSILSVSDTIALLVYLRFAESCYTVLLTYLV